MLFILCITNLRELLFQIFWFCTTIWCNIHNLNGLPKVKLYIKASVYFYFQLSLEERTISWYKILKLKNVKFVSLEENSYELLIKICVSTISGTVAGEAIKREKAIILVTAR